MRKELCLALAEYAGQTLTIDVGRAIVERLFAERGIPLEQFEPEASGDYVIHAESFRAIERELSVLHALHWMETEGHRRVLPLNPDLDAIRERERAGRLLQFTVRRGGVLVGHLRMYIHRSLHTQTEYGEEDTLFIRPEVRGSFLAIRLMRYAERALLLLGVREIRANSKLVNGADVLMKRLDYEPVALQFSKIFEPNVGEGHVR